MTRKPLRPLARIFFARTVGENPDLIERENRRERVIQKHELILPYDLDQEDVYIYLFSTKHMKHSCKHSLHVE